MSDTLRDRFVAEFGEGDAAAIEGAAARHNTNGLYEPKGSDPFRWALVITIGYKCFSKPGYAKCHGIAAADGAIKAWVQEHGDIANHDGGIDHLAMLSGAYDEYMPTEVTA